MKKIFATVLLLMASLILVACEESNNADSFDENDIVDLSNEDMATLLSEIDWEQKSGIMLSVDLEFGINIAFLLGLDRMLTAEAYSETYFYDSETISDAGFYSETDFIFSITNAESETTDGETIMTSEGEGTFNVYLNAGYLFVKPELQLSSGGTTTSISSTEKRNEAVTQEIWDDVRAGSMIEQIPLVPSMDSINEFIDEMDVESMAAWMDDFPVITVYQKNSVTDIHFEVTKSFLLDHLEDIAMYMFAGMLSSDETDDVSEDDIAYFVSMLEDEINDYETLSMTADIIIDNDGLVSCTVSIDIATDIATIENSYDEFNFSMDMALNFDVEMPDFPNDLDDYTAVDEIGKNWDLMDLLTKIVG